jgi:uncharacterized membrane protein
MPYGPMQMVVITFPKPEIPMDLRNQLRQVRDQGLVRMVDAVFVSKDEHTDIAVLEGSDLDEDEFALLGILARAFFGYGAAGESGLEAAIASDLETPGRDIFGLDEDDLLEIADSIPAGSAALFILLEHVWALGLREAVVSSRGNVIANGWITPETLAAVGAAADAFD